MNEVGQIIASEIRARRIIPFARFMELALYCPVYGYYEREEDTLGRRGDYFTSVSVGSLFGELLAFQYAEWLEALTAPSGARLKIVEGGAHDGQLAADILTWMRKERPDLYGRLEYWILEPSEARRQRQQRRLEPLAGQVRWARGWASGSKLQDPECAGSSLFLDQVQGVVFSNELLDAMPVHRLGWDAASRTWFEWGVTLAPEGFVWARMDPTDPRALTREVLSAAAGLWASNELRLLEPYLPDGFTLEVCPAAVAWWRQAAAASQAGKLLTIDYGLTAEEFLNPERKNGTLRAYRRHQLVPDVLADPGKQDLTAHVDFTALQTAGESLGLHTETFTTQSQFLTRITARLWGASRGSGEWPQARRRQFHTLTHPEHLGGPFRVLVQSRN